MCGIYFSVFKNGKVVERKKNLLENLKRRGKDFNSSHQVRIGVDYQLTFESWVMHMRGVNLSQQPVLTQQGDVLVWNGEIYDGLQVEADCSDTNALAQSLTSCQTSDDILQILSTIEGAWAMVYFHKPTNQLYFGRDYFGRRSLLCRNTNQVFELSSVAESCDDGDDWTEVACDGIYMLQMDETRLSFTCAPWRSFITKDLKINQDFHEKFTVEPLKKFLTTPMERRYEQNLSQHQFSSLSTLNPNDDPLASLEKYLEGGRDICAQFIDIMKRSVCKRLTQKHQHRSDVSSVAVLFSGGIDCTVIALLADLFIPKDQSVDLLNVAFEKHGNLGKFQVPDRVTGLSSLQELQKLCPERRWRFVEIDVELDDLRSLRNERIAHLTYPKETVLDDSIACAIWFAARGHGRLLESNEEYQSTAQLLLCGMGADEQLGGYSRHRGIYQNTNKNLQKVAEEIEMEIERISSRNLGRDDRVISDHHKEARFPYLDEEVVSFLHNLPINIKMDYELPRGVGEKLLLRASAFMLGLRECAVLPKRAIQFGSRVAKAENTKEKGNDKCSRLKMTK